MTDTTIKGTGNSRSLGSVPNFLTLYPTYEAFAQALINKTLPIDLGPLNDAGLATRGNDLNKSTLLTDALCTALGLATTATPTQAMDKLRQLTATAQSAANSAQSTANGRARIEHGSYSGSTGTLNFSFPWKLFIACASGTTTISGDTSSYPNCMIFICIRSSYAGLKVFSNYKNSSETSAVKLTSTSTSISGGWPSDSYNYYVAIG